MPRNRTERGGNGDGEWHPGSRRHGACTVYAIAFDLEHMVSQPIICQVTRSQDAGKSHGQSVLKMLANFVHNALYNLPYMPNKKARISYNLYNAICPIIPYDIGRMIHIGKYEMKKNRNAAFQEELNQAENQAREEKSRRDAFAQWESERWANWGWEEKYQDDRGWMDIIESHWDGGLIASMYGAGEAISLRDGRDEKGRIENHTNLPIPISHVFLLQSILEGIAERGWGFCPEKELNDEIEMPEKISIIIGQSKEGKRMIELSLQWDASSEESQFYASYLDCIKDLQSRFYFEDGD